MTSKFYTINLDLGQGAYLRDTADCSGIDTSVANRQAGILTENAYQAMYRHLENYRFDGYYSASMTGTMYHGSMATAGITASPAAPPAVADIDLLPKLLEKWRGSKWNAAVSFAESGKSLDMISDRLVKIAQGAREVRRGNLPGALRAFGSSSKPSVAARKRLASKDLSGTWLELRYGWLPLINDVFDAAELREPRISTPTLRTSKKTTGGLVVSTPSAAPYAWLETNERVTRVICRLSHTEFFHPERVGLTDPLSVAWELVPFSFVVDWFAPIGDFLSSLHAIRVLPVGWYIKTDTHKWDVGVRIPFGVKVAGVYASHPAEYRFSGTKMTRTVSSSSPSAFDLAHQTYRSSSVNADWSIRRAGDALALAHQQLTRLIKR
jgi:hypothetical protein